MRHFVSSNAFLLSLLLLLLVFLPAGAVSSAYAQDATTSNVISEYRLGAGDKVRITVFGEEALTGEFVVSGTGKLSLPLLGEIDAVSLTIAQLQSRIENALSDGYLIDPKVSAEVMNYRPFYILGEVNKPGEYPYVSGLTVLNAVARAEGFTYRANTKSVFIQHSSGEKEQRYPLTSTTLVQPGDTIRIGERLF